MKEERSYKVYNVNFIPLSDLNLSEREAETLYKELRSALEHMLPNNTVDASDYEVLTVFPFKVGESIFEEYEVDNYETGMFGPLPALRKIEDGTKILFILDRESNKLSLL